MTLLGSALFFFSLFFSRFSLKAQGDFLGESESFTSDEGVFYLATLSWWRRVDIHLLSFSIDREKNSGSCVIEVNDCQKFSEYQFNVTFKQDENNKWIVVVIRLILSSCLDDTTLLLSTARHDSAVVN